MVLDPQYSGASDLVAQLLESSLGKNPEQHLGDPLPTLREAFFRRKIGVVRKSAKAFSADLRDDRLDSAPLELETGSDRCGRLTAQYSCDAENLSDFAGFRKGRVSENILEGPSQPLEVPQRDRQDETLTLWSGPLGGVRQKEWRKPELGAFEIVFDELDGGPPASQPLGCLAGDV